MRAHTQTRFTANSVKVLYVYLFWPRRVHCTGSPVAWENKRKRARIVPVWLRANLIYSPAQWNLRTAPAEKNFPRDKLCISWDVGKRSHCATHKTKTRHDGQWKLCPRCDCMDLQQQQIALRVNSPRLDYDDAFEMNHSPVNCSSS